MADLALSSTLIDEYIKYIFYDDFDRDKMRKVLKYIQPFSIRESHPILSDPAMPMMLENDPLIEIVEDMNDDELVKSTLLKLMLVDSSLVRDFTTLNINSTYEKLDIRFGATYTNRMDKNKAQQHIKSLLESSKWIRVIDRYIATSSNQWGEYKNILQNILPNTPITITIQSNPLIDKRYKDDLKTLFPNWSEIQGQRYNIQNTHDRYIETDKVRILLSSGLFHLSTTSNMDFTYIITIK